jgi:hypothetical protein
MQVIALFAWHLDCNGEQYYILVLLNSNEYLKRMALLSAKEHLTLRKIEIISLRTPSGGSVEDHKKKKAKEVL